MVVNKLKLAIATSLLAFSGLSLAQHNMERVEVRGERTRAFFEKQLQQAQLDFIEAYNAKNTISEYTIACLARAKVGTHIKEKECLPRFLRDALAEESARARLIPGYQYSPDKVNFFINDIREGFHQHMQNLSVESPELMERLVAVAQWEKKINEMKVQ